ncbi:MAG: hypothetical protein QW728_04665 [Thermoplasmata archaeon]
MNINRKDMHTNNMAGGFLLPEPSLKHLWLRAVWNMDIPLEQ